jgi:hypothetical protein
VVADRGPARVGLVRLCCAISLPTHLPLLPLPLSSLQRPAHQLSVWSRFNIHFHYTRQLPLEAQIFRLMQSTKLPCISQKALQSTRLVRFCALVHLILSAESHGETLCTLDRQLIQEVQCACDACTSSTGWTDRHRHDRFIF